MILSTLVGLSIASELISNIQSSVSNIMDQMFGSNGSGRHNSCRSGCDRDSQTGNFFQGLKNAESRFDMDRDALSNFRSDGSRASFGGRCGAGRFSAALDCGRGDGNFSFSFGGGDCGGFGVRLGGCSNAGVLRLGCNMRFF